MRLALCILLLCAPGAFAQNSGTGQTLQRALAAHQRRDFAEAIKAYREVLAARPALTEARLNLAAALGELKRFDEAIAVLESAPPADRGKLEIEQNLALAYYGKGDLPSAARELERLMAVHPSDLRAINLLADCYLRLKLASKAVALLEPALKAHPGDSNLNYQFGSALIRSGRVKEGIDALERAGRLSSNADAYLLAGATALDTGEIQRARADLDRAVQFNPRLPGVWTWAGMARDRVSDEDGAKQAFHKALEQQPDDFEANLHLGAILYRERELDAARPYLERALKIQPSSNLAQYAYALVCSALGETDTAVKHLETVVAAAPEWVEPHIKLASLYFRLRRRADGQRQQQIAEQLKQDNRGQPVPFPTLEARP